MKSFIRRRRPSASMLVAVVALFVSLGGTSVAAIVITGSNVKNGSLTGADVKDRSLNGYDVANNSLRGNKIQNGSVGGLDVINESLRGRDVKDGTLGATDVKDLKGSNLKDDTLTGTQINESTLGTVPSAASAGGVSPVRFSVRMAPGAAEQKLLDTHGLQLFASCPATGIPVIRAATTVSGANVQAEYTNGAGDANSVHATKFDTGQSLDISSTAQRGSGTLAYAQPSSAAGVSLLFGFDGGTDTATLNGCVVNGTALAG